MSDCTINRSPSAKRAWNYRLRQREKQARGKRWEHIDGGCMLAPCDGGYCPKGETPCDDTYQERRTGREVSFPVTACQHWEMPFGFDDPREVIGLPGVGKPKYRRAPTKKQKKCEKLASAAVEGAAGKSGSLMVDLRQWRRIYRKCMRGGR